MSNLFPVQPKHSLGKIESFLNGLLDDVSVEDALCAKNTLIDVRTVYEFEKGSIPNSFSYPLFDNSDIGIRMLACPSIPCLPEQRRRLGSSTPLAHRAEAK